MRFLSIRPKKRVFIRRKKPLSVRHYIRQVKAFFKTKSPMKHAILIKISLE